MFQTEAMIWKRKALWWWRGPFQNAKQKFKDNVWIEINLYIFAKDLLLQKKKTKLFN